MPDACLRKGLPSNKQHLSTLPLTPQLNKVAKTTGPAKQKGYHQKAYTRRAAARWRTDDSSRMPPHTSHLDPIPLALENQPVIHTYTSQHHTDTTRVSWGLPWRLPCSAGAVTKGGWNHPQHEKGQTHTHIP
jgi:hypothetical protein